MAYVMYSELALTEVFFFFFFSVSIIYISQGKWECHSVVVISSDQNLNILSQVQNAITNAKKVNLEIRLCLCKPALGNSDLLIWGDVDDSCQRWEGRDDGSLYRTTWEVEDVSEEMQSTSYMKGFSSSKVSINAIPLVNSTYWDLRAGLWGYLGGLILTVLQNGIK